LAQDQTAAQLMQTVQSSLVEVRTLDTKTFNEGNGHVKVGSYQTQGSGVIIGSDGVIVTNTHIVSNAPHIFVGLSDGTVLEARIVYSSDADFSFLKVDPPYPLQPISWADSSLAHVGTPVIALSNADEAHQHILGGEITNLIDGVSSNNVELFELNLNLYHGDSGGPLLDDQGNLLGLITAKRIDKDNKSYAIASNKIQQEYLQYKQNPPAS
jgi:S1-C subfamily serine protease